MILYLKNNENYIEYVPVLPRRTTPDDFTTFKQFMDEDNIMAYLVMDERGHQIPSRTYLWLESAIDPDERGLAVLVQERWDN